jgi:hypothetical protein
MPRQNLMANGSKSCRSVRILRETKVEAKGSNVVMLSGTRDASSRLHCRLIYLRGRRGARMQGM